MNKKFSTLMAVFLAAGATFTAEAGVVKVTTLINGKQYVVADKDWAIGANKPVLSQNEAGTGVVGIIGDASKYSTMPLWTVVKSTNDQLLKSANGKYLDGQTTVISLKEALDAANQKVTYNSSTPSIKIGTQSNVLKFGGPEVGSTVTYPVTDAADGTVAFYAESYDAADDANLVITLANDDKVLLKVGDKYVAAKAKTGTEVELISIDWANPNYNDVLRATWKYATVGTTYLSVYTSENTNKYLSLSSNSLALGSTNGINFDGDGYAAVKKAALTSADGTKVFTGSEFVDYTAENQDKQPEALLYKAPEVVTASQAGAIDVRQFVNSGWYYVSLASSNNYLADNGSEGSATFAKIADANAVKADKFLWKVEITSKAGKQVVTLKNKVTGNYFTVGSTSSFSASTDPAYTCGMQLMVGAEYVKDDLTLTSDQAAASGAMIGLHLPGNVNYTAGEMNDMTSNGFSMAISTAKENGSTTIEGANTFAGVLKAIATTSGANRFQLQDADGKFIVLSKTEAWGSNTDMNGNNLNNRGLKFAKVETVDATKQYSYFEIKYPQVNDKASNEELVIEVYDAASAGNLVGRMYVGSIAGKNYLTVSKTIDASKEVWPYLSLGGSDLVDLKTFIQKGKFYTVAQVNEDYQIEKVLGTAIGGDAALLDKGAVQMDQPEGQWAASVVAGKLVLTNRESKAAYDKLGILYSTDKDNVYKNGDKLYLINAVEKHAATDGYEAWTNEQLRDEQYTFGFYSNVLGAAAYLSENHSNKHLIGLEKDIKNATSWNVKAFDAKRTDAAQTDSVYVISNLYFWNKDKKGGADWDFVADTLKTVSYKFINAANGEPVKFSNEENAYVCDEDKAVDNAPRFAIKKMADGKYNVVAVKANSASIATDKYYVLGGNKLYGGFSVAQGNVNATGMYNKSENDLVVLEKTAAPEYVKRNMGDTIRIFREGAEASILFEKGEFLGLENIHEFTKMAPAMYVDTAYYNRGTNNRWQYLLGVEIDRKVVNDDCGVPSHEKFHADTTYGRFLVNLVDSAELYKKTHLHDNKYVNTEGFAKLGFVKGFHTNDTLIIQRNGVLIPAKEDSIYMGSKDFNLAKFAFRIVDHETNAFKIETLYKKYSDGPEGNGDKLGYLKWMNGYVVVVNAIENGDTFNLEADPSAPTANDNITASTFSVVATDGAVIIKGAAGKTVSISNMVGQTIASRVLSSDNETVNVSVRGVIIVSVEGEPAVKAIVK